MNKVYVGNLSYNVNEQELETLFSEYGSISSVRLIKDYDTGRSKGFAFIEFDNETQAKSALQLNDKEVQGRSIIVNLARDKRPKSPRERSRDRL